MGRRNIEDRNTRKLVRTGGSLVVSIPKEIVKQLKWREKQRVVLRKSGSGVRISDWKPKSRKK